jgi:hypothetical protein
MLGGLVGHSNAVRRKTWIANLVLGNYRKTGFEFMLEAFSFFASF